MWAVQCLWPCGLMMFCAPVGCFWRSLFLLCAGFWHYFLLLCAVFALLLLLCVFAADEVAHLHKTGRPSEYGPPLCEL